MKRQLSTSTSRGSQLLGPDRPLSSSFIWVCCFLFCCLSPQQSLSVFAFQQLSPLSLQKFSAIHPTILHETLEDDAATKPASAGTAAATGAATDGTAAGDRWAKANQRRANHPDPTAKNNNNSHNRGRHNGQNNNNNQNNQNKKRYNTNRGRSSNNNNSRNYNNNNNSNNNGNFAQARELNQQLIAGESAKDLLKTLQDQKGALTAPAGGGKLNSVNFSTSIHRIARHLNQLNYNNNNQNNRGNNNNQNDSRYHRALILSDPRFALLLCGLSEALGGVSYDSNNPQRTAVSFGSREMSNIAWALAKMKVAPPQSASPLLSEANYKTVLLDSSKQLREQVIQVAKDKQQGADTDSSSQQQQQAWIPTLSLLCGYILDTISLRTTRDDPTLVASKIPFQERANLLWALATASRASETVFDTVMNQMIDDMEKQLLSQQSGDSPPPPPPKNNSRNNNNYGKDDNILQPQEWSNSLWAFATAQVFGKGQVRLLQFVANALETQDGFRERYKAQEVSNTAWAVATILSKKDSDSVEKKEQDAAVRILRQVAMAVSERADEFKTQELSNTLWAFATLGFGMSTSSTHNTENTGPATLNHYVMLFSDDPEGDEKLLSKATDAVLASALPRIHRFRSQELNNMAWALARMDRRDATTYLEATGLQLCDGRRKVTPQDVGTTLWSMATLDYLDEGIYRGIASRLTVDRARLFKPQELSNTLWALATAEISPKYPDMYDTTLIPPEHRFSGPLQAIDDPVTLCFGVAAEEMMRRPFEFKSQEIKDILWSFSKIGMRHPDLFKAMAEHLVGSGDNQMQSKGTRKGIRGLDDFSPQGLGNMVWAFARQAQLVAEVNARSEIAANVASKSGRMSVYATSFFDIGEVLVQRLLNAIAEADLRMHDNLSKLKPQDISNTAWAMAVLGMRHEPFLKAAEQQLLERTSQYTKGKKSYMTTFKGQELANLVWAFAILNFPLRHLETAVAPYMIESTVGSMKDLDPAGIARAYKRQELANIAWSCAVIGEYPQDLMALLYCGLVGDGDQFDASHLNECFRDGGLQPEAIMTLIYLQLAMEQQKSDNGLALPANFPEGWSRNSLSPSSASDLTDTTFELNLSTSKIQRDVSAAFRRIGFDHVEEHVITADELLENQGMALASNYQNVVSIDIANLESRIGIEVDGPAHYVADIEAVPTTGGQPQIRKGRLEYQFSMNGERHHVNGPTVLKKRLLEQKGWKTINIPFWEWYDLKGDEASEEAYCRRVLEQINQ